MKNTLTILTLTTAITTFASDAEDMAVDQADSLDFSEFHQNDSMKLIGSNAPQPVHIGGDNKNISNNFDDELVTASYTDSQDKNAALLAVENLAAQKCSSGWREADKWVTKENSKFIVNYQFKCRQ
ncbi:hypothetical protein SIN8267_03440 [Sinobacterium norvegicum]|uniref:Uncharacterized protein n=1 Tax=Sinobacterium norvegicum TaxID=1641715 RepID=A0ABN8EQG6_9GAMM|nr:hypothetical protein [Sinobacterium norvegicum]CAH0993292.1 hypothetical protein SIN8267_03440 [Sinobacterium norvegicum]